MKTIYLSFLIFYGTFGFGQWIQIEESAIEDPCFWAIQFPAEDTGFVIGHSLIGKTEDGGDTWAYTEIDGSFSKVDFINTDTGIVCCGVTGGENFTMTYDGGETWDFPTQFFIVGQDIEFLKDGTIFILENFGGTAYLHKFSNFYNEYIGSEDWLGYGIDIDFPVIDTGYINGFLDDFVDESSVVRSEDGGSIWSSSSLGVTGPIDELVFPSARVGYGRGDDTRRIWKSVDYGYTWNLLPWEFGGLLEDWQIDISKIYFFDENTGYLSVHTNPDLGVDHYEVFRTEDGGESWDSTSFSEDDIYVSDIYCTDPLTCYLSTCIGGIYKTTNGGGNIDTTVTNSISHCIATFDIKIFPNPASNTITFSFPDNIIPQYFITYNAYGENIDINVTGNLVLDISKITPGIYTSAVIIDGKYIIKNWIKF